MFRYIIHFFANFPPEIATFLMAATPVGELRLALPVAILRYNLPWLEAFILAVGGNMLPVVLISLGAERFHRWVQKRAGRWGKDWSDYLAAVQKKFSGPYQKYGLWGLVVFIGIPLPMTGAWSAAIAAFIFGIPLRKSWPYMLGGVAISAVITLLVAVGADKIF